jgi:hypothetical protein
VVFPTPPFWLATAIIFMTGRENAELNLCKKSRARLR